MVYRESATVSRAKQCCFSPHFDTYCFNMTKLVAEHFSHVLCRIGIEPGRDPMAVYAQQGGQLLARVRMPAHDAIQRLEVLLTSFRMDQAPPLPTPPKRDDTSR
jgi:hypothetical protein